MAKKWRRGGLALHGVAAALLVGAPWALVAQDYSVLRINEVMSNNNTTGPTDSKGLHHDMVELYNGGDVPLTLGSSIFAERLGLSDTPVQPLLGLWTFPTGVTIPAKGFLVVFLEDDPTICDLHSNFALAQEGSEPITLWGRAGLDGKRTILDQVWLPPLSSDVSFGRFPDGAGPAPVPVEETMQYFGFHPPGKATFGACVGECAAFTRVCAGAPNIAAENLAPNVTREAHSTNHPAPGEAVEITARVKDDKEPTPPNIARVYLRYAASGSSPAEVTLTYDSATGIVTGESQGQPLDRWTLWKGTIPGQPDGTRVDFTLHVEDVEGLEGGDPNLDDLCDPGQGPCSDLGIPGPNCEKEPAPGLRYFPCEVPFQYVVGYEPPERLRGLIINEVIAAQTNVLRDPSDVMYDDIIELFNGSAEPISLTGLWLSDKAFHPQGWQFPAGTIAPGDHMIIWADADGGLCPRPTEKVPGDGQDCPDPTDAPRGVFHTNFALERNGDELYLYEQLPAGAGFGVVDGVEFGLQEINVSLSLIPDGNPDGEFVSASEPTPGQPNKGSTDPLFRRGEVDGNCNVDLTDAVFILNYLFTSGGPILCLDAGDTDDNGAVDVTDAVALLNHLFQGVAELPPPGSAVAGPDPTADDLAACVPTECP